MVEKSFKNHQKLKMILTFLMMMSVCKLLAGSVAHSAGLSNIQ